jgi:hypothetical protein
MIGIPATYACVTERQHADDAGKDCQDHPDPNATFPRRFAIVHIATARVRKALTERSHDARDRELSNQQETDQGARQIPEGFAVDQMVEENPATLQQTNNTDNHF